MTHPWPCRYDDSMTGGGVDPATDFCSCKPPAPERAGLKACPFCNRDVHAPIEDASYWRVVCNLCFVKGPLRNTEAEARAAWNRRSE